MKVALLTAGKDLQYALGLAPALAATGINLEVVGNSEMEAFPGLRHPALRFFNLRGDQRSDAVAIEKILRVARYYAKLVSFGWKSQAAVFHILWPNKFVHFDRTVLNFYYRCLGKRLVFTAHNINTEARDQRDSVMNRLSLRIQYRLMDHVFVHTQEMKSELTRAYGVGPEKVTVLDFPINNVTPRTNLSGKEARLRLGIPAQQKTILFFGNIAAYKGLQDLIQALPQLRNRIGEFRVLVAGNVKAGEASHLKEVRELISRLGVSDLVDERIGYIPEEEVELYFKSADLLILPYRRICQSGVLFLSYGFGLPVVVADAGSLRQEIIEGKTGFVCRCEDPEDLAEQVQRYFESALFGELEVRRSWIIDYANRSHSWERLALKSLQVYEHLLGEAKQSDPRPISSRQ